MIQTSAFCKHACSCKRCSSARPGTHGQHRRRKPGLLYVWILMPCAWWRMNDGDWVVRQWVQRGHAGCTSARYGKTSHMQLARRDPSVFLDDWCMELGWWHGEPLFLRNELPIILEPLLTVTSTFRTPLYEREFPLSRNFHVGTNVNVWWMNVWKVAWGLMRTNEDYHSTKRHTREIILNKG